MTSEEPESSAPDDPVPNWLERRRQRAELEALNELGRQLADRFPTPPQRFYAGSLRRPRPRR
jgi:hypothetical protein